MESFTTNTRKIGNSIGLLIPKEIIEKENLPEGGKVRISIAPEMEEKIFGRFKDIAIDDLDDFVAENKDAWGN